MLKDKEESQLKMSISMLSSSGGDIKMSGDFTNELKQFSNDIRLGIEEAMEEPKEFQVKESEEEGSDEIPIVRMPSDEVPPILRPSDLEPVLEEGPGLTEYSGSVSND